MRLLNNEYVIELDDILNNSEITEEDIKNTFGDNYKKELERMTRKIYRAIDLGYNGTDTVDHHKITRQLIINDTNRQKGFMYAVIEYIRMAIINGGDMVEYETGIFKLPNVVLHELIRFDCWFPYDFNFELSDISG
jgi:hypothetical protein